MLPTFQESGRMKTDFLGFPLSLISRESIRFLFSPGDMRDTKHGSKFLKGRVPTVKR